MYLREICVPAPIRPASHEYGLRVLGVVLTAMPFVTIMYSELGAYRGCKFEPHERIPQIPRRHCTLHTQAPHTRV